MRGQPLGGEEEIDGGLFPDDGEAVTVTDQLDVGTHRVAPRSRGWAAPCDDRARCSGRYSSAACAHRLHRAGTERRWNATGRNSPSDRKSTRLNSSHANISYAVFCLKKKKITLRCKRMRSY